MAGFFLGACASSPSHSLAFTSPGSAGSGSGAATLWLILLAGRFILVFFLAAAPDLAFGCASDLTFGAGLGLASASDLALAFGFAFGNLFFGAALPLASALA